MNTDKEELVESIKDELKELDKQMKLLDCTACELRHKNLFEESQSISLISMNIQMSKKLLYDHVKELIKNEERKTG